MSDMVCKQCGKSLVYLPDSDNPNQRKQLLGHYLIGTQTVCVECHNGEIDSELKKEVDKVSHSDAT